MYVGLGQLTGFRLGVRDAGGRPAGRTVSEGNGAQGRNKGEGGSGTYYAEANEHWQLQSNLHVIVDRAIVPHYLCKSYLGSNSSQLASFELTGN